MKLNHRGITFACSSSPLALSISHVVNKVRLLSLSIESEEVAHQRDVIAQRVERSKRHNHRLTCGGSKQRRDPASLHLLHYTPEHFSKIKSFHLLFSVFLIILRDAC